MILSCEVLKLRKIVICNLYLFLNIFYYRHKLYMEYLHHKVSNENLLLIFKDSEERSIFIHTYPYFGDDNNNEFYQAFINANILSKNAKKQEDAIELSLVTAYFKPLYLEVIAFIIYSRKTFWIKLLCLDWLFEFSGMIPGETYRSLNIHASKANNELLKLQSLANLLLSGQSEDLTKQLSKLLTHSKNPAVFYRLAHGLTDVLVNNISKKAIEEFIPMINENAYLTEKQKIELAKIYYELSE